MSTTNPRLALAMDKTVTIFFRDTLCRGGFCPTITVIDVLP
jgi:hypothetical protein